MDNRFSNTRQDPVTQAAEFFIEFRAGDGTPAVRARFEQWLRSSPENVQAYLEIAAGWSELPTADPEGRIDLEALLAVAREAEDDNVIHLALGQADVVTRAPPSRARLWALVASLVLLVTLAGAGIWTYVDGGHTYKTG